MPYPAALVETSNREAQSGRKVFFIPEHDINLPCDFSIDRLGAFLSTDTLPERGTIIEIV